MAGAEQGIGESGGLKIEEGAKTAQRRIGPGSPGGLGERLDRVHQGVAGVDIDARLGVGQAVGAITHLGLVRLVCATKN